MSASRTTRTASRRRRPTGGPGGGGVRGERGGARPLSSEPREPAGRVSWRAAPTLRAPRSPPPRTRAKLLSRIAASEHDGVEARDYGWLVGALDQLRTARRVLCNSYAFAYFFFGGAMFAEDFTEEQNAVNRNLFEDNQEMLAQEVGTGWEKGAVPQISGMDGGALPACCVHLSLVTSRPIPARQQPNPTPPRPLEKRSSACLAWRTAPVRRCPSTPSCATPSSTPQPTSPPASPTCSGSSRRTSTRASPRSARRSRCRGREERCAGGGAARPKWWGEGAGDAGCARAVPAALLGCTFRPLAPGSHLASDPPPLNPLALVSCTAWCLPVFGRACAQCVCVCVCLPHVHRGTAPLIRDIAAHRMCGGGFCGSVPLSLFGAPWPFLACAGRRHAPQLGRTLSPSDSY